MRRCWRNTRILCCAACWPPTPIRAGVTPVVSRSRLGLCCAGSRLRQLSPPPLSTNRLRIFFLLPLQGTSFALEQSEQMALAQMAHSLKCLIEFNGKSLNFAFIRFRPCGPRIKRATRHVLSDRCSTDRRSIKKNST